MEVGPWRVDGKGGLNAIEGGWEEYTTMVYGASCYAGASVFTDRPCHAPQLINLPGLVSRILRQTTISMTFPMPQNTGYSS